MTSPLTDPLFADVFGNSLFVDVFGDPLFVDVFNDPLFVGLLVVLLGFVLFMYLFIRRTITGFQEGVDQGRR